MLEASTKKLQKQIENIEVSSKFQSHFCHLVLYVHVHADF